MPAYILVMNTLPNIMMLINASIGKRIILINQSMILAYPAIAINRVTQQLYITTAEWCGGHCEHTVSLQTKDIKLCCLYPLCCKYIEGMFYASGKGHHYVIKSQPLSILQAYGTRIYSPYSSFFLHLIKHWVRLLYTITLKQQQQILQ